MATEHFTNIQHENATPRQVARVICPNCREDVPKYYIKNTNQFQFNMPARSMGDKILEDEVGVTQGQKQPTPTITTQVFVD